MTSLIRATDVDTNQIIPFMPSDLFLLSYLCVFVCIKAYADPQLSGSKSPFAVIIGTLRGTLRMIDQEVITIPSFIS